MCNKCLICILNLPEQKTVYSWMQSVTVVTLHNNLILHILFCLSATLLWLILLAEASTLVKLSSDKFSFFLFYPYTLQCFTQFIRCSRWTSLLFFPFTWSWFVMISMLFFPTLYTLLFGEIILGLFLFSKHILPVFVMISDN